MHVDITYMSCSLKKVACKLKTTHVDIELILWQKYRTTRIYIVNTLEMSILFSLDFLRNQLHTCNVTGIDAPLRVSV